MLKVLLFSETMSSWLHSSNYLNRLTLRMANISVMSALPQKLFKQKKVCKIKRPNNVEYMR